MGREENINKLREILVGLSKTNDSYLIRTSCGLEYHGTVDIDEETDRVEIWTGDCIADVGLAEITHTAWHALPARNESVVAGRLIIQEGLRVTHGEMVGPDTLFQPPRDELEDYAGRYRVTVLADIGPEISEDEWRLKQQKPLRIRHYKSEDEAQGFVASVYMTQSVDGDRHVTLKVDLPFAFPVVPTDINDQVDGSPVLGGSTTVGASGDEPLSLRYVTISPLRGKRR